MQKAVKLMAEAGTTEEQKLPRGIAWSFVVGYVGLTLARSGGWVPRSWGFIPVIETAWLSFVLVLAVITWMKVRGIPLAHVGLAAFPPSRWLFGWVIGTMAVDSLAIGIATPALAATFEEPEPLARF